MSKYNVSLVLSVRGKKDTLIYLECPDDACYDACEDEYIKSVLAIATFRRADRGNPESGDYRAKMTWTVYEEGDSAFCLDASWEGLSVSERTYIEGQVGLFAESPAVKNERIGFNRS